MHISLCMTHLTTHCGLIGMLGSVLNVFEYPCTRPAGVPCEAMLVGLGFAESYMVSQPERFATENQF